ncbi:alpha-hydroxy acid oxidase [Paracandidimonas soli]|uniref:L-lactate dehydrogenase (Cytochrome) n=1 Tax=Paracandidimonas soli TaxID=1917182 RepID=A0A4R3V2M3_9BURK|nr:alpha-hydroxy acid oxidase [Paracandidimonas soli]TCU99035.1 L-lactate dehydrogenase (cytochrome) [Paracandidimonas soli]
MSRLDKVLSIEDLRRMARSRLPVGIFGYVDGAAEDQQSKAANRRAFERWAFLPHILTNVAQRNLSRSLFGKEYAMPVGISPMGASGLCWFEGDLAMAAAAREAGVPAVLSAASSIPLEEVAAVNPDIWYQAYLPADPQVILPLFARVERAGIEVMVVTVDVPIASTRENELRNGFSLPLRPSLQLAWSGLVRPRWLAGNFAQTLMRRGVPHFENFTAQRGGPIISAPRKDHRSGRAAMSWDEIRLMRDHWKGKLVIKGVLRPEDARLAAGIGADGIVVSNHGGRQLDGACATLDALPGIAAAAGGMAVMIDSGFRRGTDVLKALCLGADFVFVGRPALYGLAAGGQAGAAKALEVLRQELDVNMALLGAADIAHLDQAYIMRAD